MWTYDNASSMHLNNWHHEQADRIASFQQSASWACFQERLGHDVFCMNGEGWSALCIERQTPLGTYWLIPAGPTISAPSHIESMLTTLATEARKRGVLWLRFEPRGIEHLPASHYKLLQSPLEINPTRTQIIRLTQEVSELWGGIAPKHRSDIKHFEAMGGTCRVSTASTDLDTFIKFYIRLGQSKSRVFRDESYLRAQFDLPLELRPQLYCAYDSEGVMISGCVIYEFAGVASYVYAASCEDIRSFRGASHALVWYAIQQAVCRGNTTFDLFGVCDPDDVHHPWYGLTKFKMKFGGEPMTYPQPYDLSLSPRYYLLCRAGYYRSRLLKGVRWLRRAH